MNPATQASKENAIINMFTLLASTGKLIKITELDMGIVDAAGETILTENLQDTGNAGFYFSHLLRFPSGSFRKKNQ